MRCRRPRLLRPHRARWEPGNPAAGTVRVGFAFVPARDDSRPALGTYVPHEGGPGYSTTGTGASYAAMYGAAAAAAQPAPRRPARHRPVRAHRLPGPAEPEDRLLRGRPPLRPQSRRPERRLHDRPVRRRPRRGDPDARSRDGGPVRRLLRHLLRPGLRRPARRPGSAASSLDSAYPTYGENGVVPDPGSGDAHARSTKACRRSPACRGHGPAFLPALRRVLARGARATRGAARRTTRDGRRMQRDGRTRRAWRWWRSARRTAPYFYRELTAALRSALRGDRVPLLKLVAEAEGGGTDAGPVRGVQRGARRRRRLPRLPAALRHDRARRARACAQYDRGADAGARDRTRTPTGRSRSASTPGRTGSTLDWCTALAEGAGRATRPRPPRPATAGTTRDVPDAGAQRRARLDHHARPRARSSARQFPNARSRSSSRNSFHVTAVGDTDDCAVRIVRRFVRTPSQWPPTAVPRGSRRCARWGSSRATCGALPAAPGAGSVLARRVGPGGGADGRRPDRPLVEQLLRAGRQGCGADTGRYSGNRTTVFHLHGVRLTRDLAVSGTGDLGPLRATPCASTSRSARPRHAGRLHGHWDTRRGAPGPRSAARSPVIRWRSRSGRPDSREDGGVSRRLRRAVVLVDGVAGCCSRSATRTRRSTPTSGRSSAAGSRTARLTTRRRCRELAEETEVTGVGLTHVDTLSYFCDDCGRHHDVALYLALTDLTDDDVVCHEGRQIVFVDPRTIDTLPWGRNLVHGAPARHRPPGVRREVRTRGAPRLRLRDPGRRAKGASSSRSATSTPRSTPTAGASPADTSSRGGPRGRRVPRGRGGDRSPPRARHLEPFGSSRSSTRRTGPWTRCTCTSAAGRPDRRRHRLPRGPADRVRRPGRARQLDLTMTGVLAVRRSSTRSVPDWLRGRPRHRPTICHRVLAGDRVENLLDASLSPGPARRSKNPTIAAGAKRLSLVPGSADTHLEGRAPPART